MATARIEDGLNHITVAESASPEDLVISISAMMGAAIGALAGSTLLGGRFEYAAVVFGTLGVVAGSIVFGLAARLVTPAWTALHPQRTNPR